MKLLGNILEKKYQGSQQNVSFEDLLEWELWPAYIKLYSVCITLVLFILVLFIYFYTVSELVEAKKGSEDPVIVNMQIICTCAVSKLDEVCQQIKSGKISVKELKKIKEQESQMEKLCDARAAGNSSKEGKSLTLFELEKLVAKRLKEYDYFKKYREQLNHILSHLNFIQGII